MTTKSERYCMKGHRGAISSCVESECLVPEDQTQVRLTIYNRLCKQNPEWSSVRTIDRTRIEHEKGIRE